MIRTELKNRMIQLCKEKDVSPEGMVKVKAILRMRPSTWVGHLIMRDVEGDFSAFRNIYKQAVLPLFIAFLEQENALDDFRDWLSDNDPDGEFPHTDMDTLIDESEPSSWIEQAFDWQGEGRWARFSNRWDKLLKEQGLQ
jgi:hypothetical protein